MGVAGDRLPPEDSAAGSLRPRAGERRRQAADVRHERDTLRALVESITDEIWFADADGDLTLLNPAVWRESGALDGESVEAIAARFEVYRPDGSQRPPAEAPSLRALRGETIRDEEEIVRTPVTGELRHRLVSGAPVRDGEGVVIGSVCLVRDVTGRKLMEEELRRSREDFGRAQAVGQIGSWRLDVRENVLTWSDENHRIFGLPHGSPLTYETFLSVVHPDDRDYVDQRWQAGLRGEPYDIEHRLLVAGEVKWVRERAFLEYDESGALLGGFGITQDVTDRKAAEEALRESEAKHATQQERARLARDLHDSVSQAIFAAALKAEALEIAGEGDDTVGPAARQVSRLCKGALADLRTMLLELRGEGIEGVPMEQLLRQLAEATEGRTSARVELVLRERAALPRDVQTAFFRVAQEALNNVARHARATLIRVEADLSESRAELVVRDDGRGFEPREFGPGHLGLSTMRERAAEVGADLMLTSAPGAGACVTLRWPGAAGG